MPNFKPSAFHLSAEALLAAILLIALVAITSYGASQSEERTYPAGSAYSNRPDGARALKLWLDDLGYTTVTLANSFWPDQTIDLLLMLSPSETIAPAQVAAIVRWVNNGGTLVWAGNDFFVSSGLLSEFELDVAWLDQPIERLSAQQPLLSTPPVRDAAVQAEAVWETTRDDYVAHLAVNDRPVLMSWQQRRGRVFVLTTVRPFTNEGLKNAGNAALVYNLILAGAGAHGKVAFDEYHHGQQAQPSLSLWLFTSRTGWAILFSAATIFVFLLIGGRRFGAPVPLPEHQARRTTAEYIHALANLKRRAGRRQAVLAHYKERLKRQLGRLSSIDPTLPDETFAAGVAERRPPIESSRLARLLADLSRPTLSERDMVRLVEQATALMEEVEG